MLQPGSSGMFVCAAFYYAIFLTAIVARQECAIACCWLLEWESPITMGPTAWLQSNLGCVCVGFRVVLVSSCPRPHWQWWQGMVTVNIGDSEEEEEADRPIRDTSCVVCCHLGSAQQLALAVCLSTTFNCCLMLNLWRCDLTCAFLRVYTLCVAN